MNVSGTEPKGTYRCGGGHSVTIFVPGRLVYEQGMCTWAGKFGGCNQASVPTIPLCPMHLAAAVETIEATEGGLGGLSSLAEQMRREVQPWRIENSVVPYEVERYKRRMIEGASVVYYVLLGSGRLKIGTTQNLHKRMRDLHISREALLAAEPGTYPVETYRHRQFKRLLSPQHSPTRSREEFEYAQELQEHVARVREQHGDPYRLADLLRSSVESEFLGRNSCADASATLECA